jgi:hypothetical protein
MPYLTGLPLVLGQVTDTAPVIIVPGILKNVSRRGAPFSDEHTNLVAVHGRKAYRNTEKHINDKNGKDTFCVLHCRLPPLKDVITLKE